MKELLTKSTRPDTRLTNCILVADECDGIDPANLVLESSDGEEEEDAMMGEGGDTAPRRDSNGAGSDSGSLPSSLSGVMVAFPACLVELFNLTVF